MNVLLLGSGGREHAMAWKLAQSPLLTTLFIAPGNPGTAQCGKNIPLDITDFDAIRHFVLENNITLVVSGPEEPLVNGIADYFAVNPELEKVGFIGPGREGAQLEGSKSFAKRFMEIHGIPTARYKVFLKPQLNEAKKFLLELKPPYVLKADGLAAGKGVTIHLSKDEAEHELTELLDNEKFGEASSRVVIEEFLSGIELSVFVLTDGENYVILPEAKDYKRIGERDEGPNTGGMGAVSPVPFADAAFMEKVETQIIQPTVKGLKKDGIPYKGFIFIGLMNVNGNPSVIEYNVRMGDPETEAVLPRLKSDLLDLFVKTSAGTLNEAKIETDERTAVTVVTVSGGYPGVYEKGIEMSIPQSTGDTLVFHAGTRIAGGKTETAGGRVAMVTAYGANLREARDKAYGMVENIRYEGRYFRRDIGMDLEALT